MGMTLVDASQISLQGIEAVAKWLAVSQMSSGCNFNRGDRKLQSQVVEIRLSKPH